MKVAFISGHLDLTKEEFAEHYEGPIRSLASLNYTFVVGDAPGCDFMAQRFLHELGACCVVYHMFDAPRHNFGHGKEGAEATNTVGGFKSDKERDAALTAASDIDIAWVRPGREKSGTAANLARRRKSRQTECRVKMSCYETCKKGTRGCIDKHREG